jgi:nucleoside-diphosphate-sugar epimerase
VSRVLLTGASGFIGRHTLTALAGAGHEVHAVARTPGAAQPGVVWHEADLLAGCEVLAEVQPEVLVHLAWYAEHGKFWFSTENVRWVQASLALLRAFAAAGGRRAVIAGSCAEYEWTREVYPESAPIRPATLYGASKHGLHVVAGALCEQAEIELAWGRLFFLYGPFEAPGRLVASLVLSLLRGERAQMTAGTQRRDFLHAADAGAAFAALADSSVAGSVNVASGGPVALHDLAREIAGSIGREDLLQVGALAMPAGEPPSLVADVGRLRDEVGWTPSIELYEGLRGVIEWWRERLTAGRVDGAAGDG